MRTISKLFPLVFCAVLSNQAMASRCARGGLHIGSSSSGIGHIEGGSGKYVVYLVKNEYICPRQKLTLRANAYGFNPGIRMVKCGTNLMIPGARYTAGTSTHPSDPFQKAIRYELPSSLQELCFNVIIEADPSALKRGVKYKYDYHHSVE